MHALPSRRFIPPLLAALVLAAGCGPLAPRRPNILLVTLDTTRADRLGCYGYTNAVTPALDRLAREGVRLTAAATTAPITLPAHATMLTGLHPAEHGLRLNGLKRLPDELPTIAETFKGAGYRTGAFVAFTVLSAAHGLARGFDTYDEPQAGDYRTLTLMQRIQPDRAVRPYRRGGAIADAALAWLRQEEKKPWFAWVHFYDPHHPLHWNRDTVGDAFTDPYDAEVAYMDHQIGRLLDWLDASGQADRTLVVAVGDHGEGLGDHGESDHRFLLYESTLHIPWIFRQPGRLPAGRALGAGASLVQLAPTLLDLAGVAPHPALARLWQTLAWTENVAGAATGAARADSLAPAMLDPGRHPARDFASYAETDHPYSTFGWAPLRSLRLGPEKYIRAPLRELYRLDTDPGESRNRAGGEAARAAELERLLAEREDLFRRHAAPEAAISQADWRMLASVGYAAGAKWEVPEAPDLATLSNPVEVLRASELATQLKQMIHAGHTGTQALAVARSAIAIAPATATFHAYLAQLHELRREPEEAVAAYREALRLDPREPRVSANLGILLSLTGKQDEGLELLEKAHALDAENPEIRKNLGVALEQVARRAADAANYTGALERLEALIALDPANPVHRINQSRLYRSLGRTNEAQRILRETAARHPGHPAILRERQRDGE